MIADMQRSYSSPILLRFFGNSVSKICPLIEFLTKNSEPVASNIHNEADQNSAMCAVGVRRFEDCDFSFAIVDQNIFPIAQSAFGFSADFAVLNVFFVDRSSGSFEGLEEHLFTACLLGENEFTFAINYIRSNEFDLSEYENIVSQCGEVVSQIEKYQNQPLKVSFIPISSETGGNILSESNELSWTNTNTFIEHIGQEGERLSNTGSVFRMEVKSTKNSINSTACVAGRVLSGSVKAGDRVKILPSSDIRLVESVRTDINAGVGVSLSFTNSIAVSSGDIICNADSPAELADQFEVAIFWGGEQEMFVGRTYSLEANGQRLQTTITAIKYKVNPKTFSHEPATKLAKNEIGICNIGLDQKLVFDEFEVNNVTGSFSLSDRVSGEFTGFGLIKFALRRASNIHPQAMDVSKAVRAEMKGQKPAVLWFTGLSGSGKSTIANILEKKLTEMGKHTYSLDGDNVRHGLNQDLGFTDADRVENIRRITQVAKLMTDAGLIVLASFISPFRAERQMARKEFEAGEFLEIFVDTPLEIAEARDIKGLYKKARAGEIKNFTGIDSPYEPPKNAEILVNTARMSAEESANKILGELEKRGLI